MGKESICDMTDTMATAHALGGKFEREDCGFFENCDHRVEKYDMTIPGGSMVEIFYCSIDWRKVGPLLLVLFVVLGILYRRLGKWRSGSGGSSSSSSSSHSKSRHHR